MLAARTRSRAHAAAGFAVRRARELADPLALALRGRSLRGPLPPRRLRARTGAPGIREFADGGRRAAAELEAALLAAGLPGLAARRSVLDFGCGAARVLPHVAALAPGARCDGCDVDATAVAWASRHHPALTFTSSGSEPPLPFADAAFDLVYSISVFSHLDEPLQDRWLAELRRVLAPGGTALLSVHGTHAFDAFRTGAVRTGWCEPGAFDRPPLAPDEIVFVPYLRSRWNVGELPGVGAGYGLTFHGEAYLRREWGEVLHVVAIVPRGLAGWQDAVVCR